MSPSPAEESKGLLSQTPPPRRGGTTLNVITLVRTNLQISSTHQSYYPPRFYPPKFLPTKVYTFSHSRNVSRIPYISFTICSKVQKVDRTPTKSWRIHQSYYPPKLLPTKVFTHQSFYPPKLFPPKLFPPKVIPSKVITFRVVEFLNFSGIISFPLKLTKS